MKMTIGAVLTAPSSQPQAKASESGFSNVLAEVKTSSQSNGKTEFSYTEQKSSEMAKALGDLDSAQSAPDFNEFVSVKEALSDGTYIAEFSSETISAEFKNTVISLISSKTDGSKEENDRVIDALLKILKKMQDDTEDGSAASILMELLASIAGINTDTPVFELNMTKSELCVTTENTEITAILSAEQTLSAAPEASAQPLPTESVTAETNGTVLTAKRSYRSRKPARDYRSPTAYRKLSRTAFKRPFSFSKKRTWPRKSYSRIRTARSSA